MLNFCGASRIFLARQPQDMRRGMDALATVVINEFGEDPYAGDCFIFISRNRKRLKALLYEDGGFWLGMKRLDRGTFARLAPDRIDAGRALTLTPAELQAVLEGLDVQVVRRRRRERRLVGNDAVIKYDHHADGNEQHRSDSGRDDRHGGDGGLQAAARTESTIERRA